MTTNTTDNQQSGSTSQTNASVTVNNQQIPVPQNGTVSKTITSGNGTTNVTISSSSSNSGDASSTTSSSLNVNTDTFTNNSGASFNSTHVSQ